MEAVWVAFRFRGGEAGAEKAPVRLTDKAVIVDGQKAPFNFDAVIDPDKSQAEAYEFCAKHVVAQFMAGFNGTIFAYGQSGSGKTFTMMGPETVTEALMQDENSIPPEVQASFGVIPRAVSHMFETINEGIAKEQIQYNLTASYVEIYNEKINDIMSCPVQKDLKIRELPNLGPTVMGIKQCSITAPEEVFECIAMGTANKQVASTNQNSRSSRSHTLFLLDLEQKYITGTTKKSRINLVDLAGCEKISKTGAEGQTLEEAKKINLSLTTLGRVIKALTDPKEKFVPYRESKLTVILKESLGGNSKTSLICTASMKGVHVEETVNTLRFAERAKQIQCKAKTNVQRSPAELEKIIDELKKELSTLKKQMAEGGQIVMSSGEDVNSQTKYIELKTEYENYKDSTTIQMEQLKDQLERAGAGLGNLDMSNLQEKIELQEEEILNTKQKVQSLELEKQNITQEKDLAIKQLQDENSELKMIVDQVVKDCESLDAQRQEEKEEFSKAEKKVIEQNLQLDLLQKEKDQIEKKLNNFDQERSQLKIELESAKNEVGQLSQECENLSGEMEQFQSKYQEANEKLSYYKEENDKLVEESLKFKAQIEQLKSENEEIAKECENYATKSEELQVQANQFEQSLLSEQIKIQTLTNQLNLAEEEIGKLKVLLNQQLGQQDIFKEKDNLIEKLKQSHQAQIEEVNIQIEELNKKLKSSQESELQKQKEYSEKIQSQLKQNNQELIYSKEKLRTSENEISELKNKFRDQEIQIEKLKQQQEQLKQENRKLTSELQSEQNKLKHQNTSLQDDNDRLKKEIKDFEESYKKEYMQAKESAAEANKKIKELEAKLSNLKEDYDRNEKNHLQEVNLKNHALQLSEKNASQQIEKSIELENKLAQLTSENSAIKYQLQNLQKQNEIQKREVIATKINAGNRRQSKIYSGLGMGKSIQSQVKNVFGVTLKKTQNKYLEAALQESIKSQEEEYKIESLAKLKKSQTSNVDYMPETVFQITAIEEEKQEEDQNDPDKKGKALSSEDSISSSEEQSSSDS